MLRVSIVVGNPKPSSRTRRVAELLVHKLLEPGGYECEVIDLVDHADDVLQWPSEKMAVLNRTVAESDLVIVASPTYKATYTGLLKAFLDRYPANGLAGVVAIPVHTGADFSHAMAPSYTLAPLLTELGATVPGRGFYLSLTMMDQVEKVVDVAVAEYARNLSRLSRIAAATRSSGALSATADGENAEVAS